MNILWTTDADNTLWDTDKTYADAQLKLITSIEEKLKIKAATQDKLKYLREVDQQISTQHHLGLRYPVEILISALTKRLNGIPTTVAVKSSLREGIVEGDLFSRETSQLFLKEVSNTPPLREGVLEGLKALHKVQAVVVVVVVATEGSITRIKKHLSDHCISHFITLCIEGAKSKVLYSRIANLYPDRQVWSIGDQLNRDIQPALEAGFKAIYLPGGFNPFWQ